MRSVIAMSESVSERTISVFANTDSGFCLLPLGMQ